MSQRKMLQLSVGALLLLLPWFGAPVVGEISDDFSRCLNFFYKRTPPQGITATGYESICQRYENQYRFASLYHRLSRAPLYSAYMLSPADGKRPPGSPWMYEPQLVSRNKNPEMQRFPGPKSFFKDLRQSQAVLQDYKNSGYTRGHLNPSSHQRMSEDREATFTLTNIVPQQAGSNSGPWNLLENDVLNKFKACCRGTMYVITGAMPYKSETHLINNRVSVPEYMWSAYCCPHQKSDLSACKEPFFPTYAAVGRNDPNSGEEIVPVDRKAKPAVWGYDVRQMSLKTLEGILEQRLGMSISLFKGGCNNKE